MLNGQIMLGNHKNALKFFYNTGEAADPVIKGTHPLQEELMPVRTKFLKLVSVAYL